MRNSKVLFMVQAAMIAAIYVVLTMLANSIGLASQDIQVRFSEALTILPFFTPAAIPGLFVGCIIGNIVTSCHPIDVIFGSLATLIGALGTYFIAHGFTRPGDKNYYSKNPLKKWLTPIPPIVANMLIVPHVIAYCYGSDYTLPISTLFVGAGEVISCFMMGMVLLYALEPHKRAIFAQDQV